MSKLVLLAPCAGNSPVTGEFPAQKASNAENVSSWWRHHECPERTFSTHGYGQWVQNTISFDLKDTYNADNIQHVYEE